MSHTARFPPTHPSLAPVPPLLLSPSSNERATLRSTPSNARHRNASCSSIRTMHVPFERRTLPYGPKRRDAHRSATDRPPWGHTHSNGNGQRPSPIEKCKCRARTIVTMYAISSYVARCHHTPFDAVHHHRTPFDFVCCRKSWSFVVVLSACPTAAPHDEQGGGGDERH